VHGYDRASEMGSASVAEVYITHFISICYKDIVSWFPDASSKTHGPISESGLQFPQRFPQKIGPRT
jgi:hypothetical protein